MTIEHNARENLRELVSEIHILLEESFNRGEKVLIEEKVPSGLCTALFDAFKIDEGLFRGVLAEQGLELVAIEDAEDTKEGYFIIAIDLRSEDDRSIKAVFTLYASEEIFSQIAEDLKPENPRKLKRRYYKIKVLNFFIRLRTWFIGLLTGR